MAKVIILGSSNAIADKEHENTHMVVVGNERTVLIDCARNPILRLLDVGVDFNDLTDLVITHFHPDHVSGVPLLLMDMWLRGRQNPLEIYGLTYTLDRLEKLMDFYGWTHWPDFFPVTFNRFSSSEMTPVLNSPDFDIYASPVRHMIPTAGLRIEFNQTRKVMAYSCDTEPCEQVARLAKGADVLIHESSGPFTGHTSAAQAAEVASQAKVGALYLIHYPTGEFQNGDLAAEARQNFDGKIVLAEDFMTLEF